jgi:ABC-2 type transport system permease protein
LALPLSLPSAAPPTGVLALLSLGLTAIGFAFAWRVASVQGFHAVMNLLLVPLWLLSGVLFPLAGAPGWLAALMRANPLTYGVAALRHALYPGRAATAFGGLPALPAALAVTAAVAALAFAADLAVTRGGRVA